MGIFLEFDIDPQATQRIRWMSCERPARFDFQSPHAHACNECHCSGSSAIASAGDLFSHMSPQQPQPWFLG